ncbi:HlyD family efflux transporter periplasmic adaptor subunit [Chitinophaga flava]|nr:HlyD family efflux transporter periplasmic adaptor subunit [Chitinophaga flava]
MNHENPAFHDSSMAVGEMLSANPGFLVRNGIGIFFGIITSLFALAWLVKYPDIVYGHAKMVGVNTPKLIVAKTSGKLVFLSNLNGKQVKKDEIIGIMESTAEASEVISLSQQIDSAIFYLQKKNYIRLNQLLQSDYSQLGEVQSAYRDFIHSYLQFRDYIQKGAFIQKRMLLGQELDNITHAHKNLFQQEQLYQEDTKLTQTTVDVNTQLLKAKVISELEYREQTSKLINKKLSLPQIKAALISNEREQIVKQKEIVELDNQIVMQQTIFLESLNNFKNDLAEWKRKFLLTAPVAGTLAYNGFIQENEHLQAEQHVAYVVPGNSAYYMQMVIPQENFGKVAVGQKVLLKFPSYQWEEYGSIQGKIGYISPIPTDSGYLAGIVLPDGLKTSYNKTLYFRDGLVARAEIITSDARLLERFYRNFLKNFNR